jgi:hypothetical protein
MTGIPKAANIPGVYNDGVVQTSARSDEGAGHIE